MPDRDPTPGELRIMFGNIMDSLRDVKETMATKEFVNAKFDSYNDRVARLENDVKEAILASAAARAKIEADLEAKIALVDKHFADIEKAQQAQEHDIKTQRASRNQAIFIAILSAALSIITLVIGSGILKGLFPGA